MPSSSSPRLALLAATIAGSTSPAAARATPAASLDEARYVAEVLRAGLDARTADAEAARERAEGVGAGAWANPVVGWQREASPRGPTSGGTQDIFALTLPLVPSGRLGLEREAGRLGAEAAQARRTRARAELRAEAVRAFHTALAATGRRAALAESHDALGRLAAVVAARERAGEASGYERLRVALEAAAVDDLLRGAVASERLAAAAALTLLGPDHARLPTLIGSATAVRPAADVEGLVQGLEARRADLRALRLEANAAESARRAAARAWVPEPSLNAGVQILDMGRAEEARGYVVGVELPLPLFQRRQGETARAATRRDLAEARRAALARQATASLAAAIAAAEDQRARLASHRTEVQTRAEELRKVAATAYRGGAAELLVLVDAERAAREARLQGIDLALAVIDADNTLFLLAGAYDAAETGNTR